MASTQKSLTSKRLVWLTLIIIKDEMIVKLEVWNLGLNQKGSGAAIDLDRFLCCMKVQYRRLLTASMQDPEVKVIIADICKSESRWLVSRWALELVDW